MNRANAIWLATFAIWAAGIPVIYWLWNYHFPNDLLDTIWGFVLYVVAFCYVFLIPPLHDFLELRLRRPPEDS